MPERPLAQEQNWYCSSTDLSKFRRAPPLRSIHPTPSHPSLARQTPPNRPANHPSPESPSHIAIAAKTVSVPRGRLPAPHLPQFGDPLVRQLFRFIHKLLLLFLSYSIKRAVFSNSHINILSLIFTNCTGGVGHLWSYPPTIFEIFFQSRPTTPNPCPRLMTARL